MNFEENYLSRIQACKINFLWVMSGVIRIDRVIENKRDSKKKTIPKENGEFKTQVLWSIKTNASDIFCRKMFEVVVGSRRPRVMQRRE